MEYFIYGIALGYMLYPISKIVAKIITEAYKSTGCNGNCNQGRKPCDCRKDTNGI